MPATIGIAAVSIAGMARSFYEPTTVKHYFVSPLDYLNRRVEERRDHKDLEAQQLVPLQFELAWQ